MTFLKYLICAYIGVNIIGFVIFISCSAIGYDFENWFNPNRIYDSIKVNHFGAYFLAVIAFICMTPGALIFYIYKLCTIGRK